MKSTILALGGLSVSLISVPIFGVVFIPQAIAQTDPVVIEIPKSNFFAEPTTPQNSSQTNPQQNIEIPRSNFFGESTNPPLQTTPQANPQKKLSDTADDLKREGSKVADESNLNEQKKLTAFERPLFRLFGFETANTLKHSEFIFQISGTTYNNPFDFRLVESPGSVENRSNDSNIGFTYGISDDIQISYQQAGKDDTAFANLVRPNSSLQFYNGISAGQIKWKYYDNESLKAALVVGVEFSSPTPTLFNRGGRVINFSTPGPRQVSDGATGSQFTAVDSSAYFSLALPITYQATSQLSFSLNPQVSFFPSSLPASTIAGSTSSLVANNVGFDGSNLQNYYGTVVGLGLGVNYILTPRLQIAADITPILSGRNSAGVTDGSLFIQRLVWNAGLQFAPNSRTALSFYATNRFGPSSSSASNLLVQPNGDVGYGIQFSYLPDFAGLYKIERREIYSPPSTFLSYLNGLPSSTLPVYSTLYQLSFGTNGRVNPSVRFGLLDDLELAVSFSSNNTKSLPLELSAIARLALIQDKGENYTFASTLGLGITNLYVSDANLVTLYFDIPTSYRLNSALTLTATPKFIVPAQFAGQSNILGLTLGGIYNITDTTQIMGEYTPIFSGSNQLTNVDRFSLDKNASPYSGKTGIFNIGVRQLFPSGNSLYAVDLYFTNSSSDYGLQGISAIANGGKQVGIRFTVLNGVPARKD
jgi:hypothetical protein